MTTTRQQLSYALCGATSADCEQSVIAAARDGLFLGVCDLVGMEQDDADIARLRETYYQSLDHVIEKFQIDELLIGLDERADKMLRRFNNSFVKSVTATP